VKKIEKKDKNKNKTKKNEERCWGKSGGRRRNRSKSVVESNKRRIDI